MGLDPDVTALGLGIDLVEVPRARALLERHGERIMARTLTGEERLYVLSVAEPAAHFAARLAAKEAAFKALQFLPGGNAIGWRDLEVVRAADGRPSLTLHGTAATLAHAFGPLRCHLSLSHSHESAVALVLVEPG